MMAAAHLKGPTTPTMQVVYLRAWSEGFQAGAAVGFAAGAADQYTLGCGGKVRQSRTAALATLDRRNALTSGGRGVAYRCNTCGFFHTSHRDEQNKFHRNREREHG